MTGWFAHTFIFIHLLIPQIFIENLTSSGTFLSAENKPVDKTGTIFAFMVNRSKLNVVINTQMAC